MQRIHKGMARASDLGHAERRRVGRPSCAPKPGLKKVTALFVTCLLLFLLPLGAWAETVSLSDGIQLDVPEDYTVLLPDRLKDHEEFLNKLGHSSKSFKSYMDERHMLLVAATEDNTRQIQLKSWETDFSRQIEDLSALDADALEQAADALLVREADESLLSWGKAVRGGVTYLKAVTRVTEQQADFCYIQYITVRDGVYYALVFYNFGGEVTQEQEDEADALLSSLVLPAPKGGSFLAGGNYVVQMVIVGILILAAAVISLLLVLSFIKDIRYRRREDSQTVHIKIKRRKF